jgi:hypothetical protein
LLSFPGVANEPETVDERNIYQRADRKLKASSYCGLPGMSEELTCFLSSVLAAVVYPEQHFYRMNVVK